MPSVQLDGAANEKCERHQKRVSTSATELQRLLYSSTECSWHDFQLKMKFFMLRHCVASSSCSAVIKLIQWSWLKPEKCFSSYPNHVQRSWRKLHVNSESTLNMNKRAGLWKCRMKLTLRKFFRVQSFSIATIPDRNSWRFNCLWSGNKKCLETKLSTFLLRFMCFCCSTTSLKTAKNSPPLSSINKFSFLKFSLGLACQRVKNSALKLSRFEFPSGLASFTFQRFLCS